MVKAVKFMHSLSNPFAMLWKKYYVYNKKYIGTSSIFFSGSYD